MNLNDTTVNNSADVTNRPSLSLSKFIQVVGEDVFQGLQETLNIEWNIVRISSYSGFLISAVNLTVFILVCILYRNPKTTKPTLLFIANLNLSDILLPLLSSSAIYETWVQARLQSPEVEGNSTHTQRVFQCRAMLTILTVPLVNSVMAVVWLTFDRYLNLKFPLKYPIIMKEGKIFRLLALSWVLGFCFSSTLYTLVDLRKNHACTFSFAVRREHQLLIVGIFHITVIIIFLASRNFFRKVYKRNKRLESQGDMTYNTRRNIIHKATRLYVIPISFDYPQKDSVKLTSMQCFDDEGNETSQFQSICTKKRKISKDVMFHLKCAQSSTYALVIFAAFCLFHFPIVIHQTIELISMFLGYYDDPNLHNCGGDTDTWSWSQDQDFFLGDCVRRLAYKEAENGSTCSLPADANINISSPSFCRISHQAVHEVHDLAKLLIVYWISVLNSAVNPILYTIWYRPFRDGLMKLFQLRQINNR